MRIIITALSTGQKNIYPALFEANKNRRDKALAEALDWRRRHLPEAPLHKDEMLNVTAPFLQRALAKERLDAMTYEQFRDICTKVYAIKRTAQPVANKAADIPDKGASYIMEDKVAAFSRRIWNERESDGGRVKELFQYVLYGGANAELPERLWKAVNDPKWKMHGLGINSLGELVGWALPEDFPPRNRRTSKALKSLGYDVTVHVA